MLLEQGDVLKLFNLLETLYAGSKRSRDKVTLAVWDQVLKPWTYAQVREAAIRRARVNRYFPDPSELAEYLPSVEGGTVPVSAPARRDDGVAALCQQWLELRSRREAADVPVDLASAQAAGLSAGEWLSLLDQAGLALAEA